MNLLRPAKLAPAGTIAVCIALLGIIGSAVAQRADTTFECVQYQTNVVNGVLMYLQDYDEQFPPSLNTPGQLQKYVSPYVKNRDYFGCPDTGHAYLPNASLAGKSLASIDPSQTVMITDDTAHHDGLRTTAYVDMRVLHGGKFTNTTIGCMGNANAVVSALGIYAADWDDYYPPMHTAAQMDASLGSYVKSTWKFSCPETLQAYQPNPNLSGVNENTIADPATTTGVADQRAHPDGDTTYAYLDGHAFHGQVATGFVTEPELCLNNVKRINLALALYVQDYDETFPPMQNAQVLQTALKPYLRGANPLLFICPVTGLQYMPNSALSYSQLGNIANPSTTVTLKDAARHPNGKTTYGYADFHVQQK
jgi:prepilin-type processing-associated H-X9-DG protein